MIDVKESSRMTEPAPIVEAAKASAAKPRVMPEAEPAATSERVHDVEAAPKVKAAVAEPPTERGSFTVENIAAKKSTTLEQCQTIGVSALRGTQQVAFEAPAAVIIGPADRGVCEKIFPCFAERTFVSYGEVKRYVMIVDSNIFVYMDSSDKSPPLYIISLDDMDLMKEDSNNPNFYSHTISPEANAGLPFANKSKESLETFLLLDSRGNIAFQFAFDKNEANGDVVDKFIDTDVSSKGAKKGS